MMHQTGTISSRDGTPLFYEHWAPAQAGWASVVIVQGRGEHVGRYAQTAEAFAAEGLAVWAFDLRGQGRSGGRRGHVEFWRAFLQDVEACVTHAAREASGRQPVLLGHSLGGLLALHYAVEHPQELSALILSSPLCGLAKPVSRWQDGTARWLSRWWPTFAFQRTRADASVLSHDPRVREWFLRDPLVHFRVTARFYTELNHAMARAAALATHLTVPTLVLQAGDDRLVSVEATRQMAAAIGTADKQFLFYEGFYHELFNEVDAARVIRDVVAWLRPHVVASR